MSAFCECVNEKMNKLFRSAFGSLSTSASETTSSTSVSHSQNFLGKICKIDDERFKVQNLIAEGGYGYVYSVQSVDRKFQEFALKRIIINDKESETKVWTEIKYLKQLSGHQNLIKFYSACFSKPIGEFYILTELCKDSLVNVLKNCPNLRLPNNELIAQVFFQSAEAVAHLHRQQPSIIHRDLKIENLLIGYDNLIKLCDFGSATIEIYEPQIDWNFNKRMTLEDKISGFTTPMYRAPEVVDTWNNYKIGAAVDVWALGCILYILCYTKHPFEDASVLRILNAKFAFPPEPNRTIFHSLIGSCFETNPNERPTIDQLLERLKMLEKELQIDLSKPCDNWVPESFDDDDGAN